MTFLAGYRMAGYMSDESPAEFETLEAAKRSLIWSIKHIFEEEAETETQAEEFSAAAEDINLWNSPQSIIVCGWCFFITTP